MDSAYGILLNANISWADAPPVDNTGPPKKPCINLRTTRPGKLDTRDATAVMIMKIKNEDMYATFRPIIGISDRGLNINGPMPCLCLS